MGFGIQVLTIKITARILQVYKKRKTMKGIIILLAVVCASCSTQTKVIKKVDNHTYTVINKDQEVKYIHSRMCGNCRIK